MPVRVRVCVHVCVHLRVCVSASVGVTHSCTAGCAFAAGSCCRVSRWHSWRRTPVPAGGCSRLHLHLHLRPPWLSAGLSLGSYPAGEQRQWGGVEELQARGGGVGGLWRPLTLSLLKEPVILFLRELRVLLTLVPFSTFSMRSTSSSFLHTCVVLFTLVPGCL